jgi:hypothetical protein
MAGIASCGFLGVAALLRLLEWQERRGRFFAALLAVLACGYFLRWDLHFLNSNTIFVGLAVIGLALLQQRGSGGWACALPGALCLALSIVVKPYSLLLLPYLILLRRPDAFLWTSGLLLLILFGLPALFLGPGASLELHASWLAALRKASGPDFIDQISTFNVSLHASMNRLVDTLQPGARIPRDTMQLAVRGLQSLWLALIAWALWPRLKTYWSSMRTSGTSAPISGRAIVREAGTLLVAPLALSSMFQPHQGVAVFPLALLLSTQALAANASRRLRIRHGVLAVAVFLTCSYTPNNGIHGLALLSCLAACIIVARLSIAEDQSNVRQ